MDNRDPGVEAHHADTDHKYADHADAAATDTEDAAGGTDAR